MYSHNYVGTAKRPARILRMARNACYRWRSRNNGELARVVEVTETKKDFRWFIIVKHESGNMYMLPPRMFWMLYTKEVYDDDNLCRRNSDHDG